MAIKKKKKKKKHLNQAGNFRFFELKWPQRALPLSHKIFHLEQMLQGQICRLPLLETDLLRSLCPSVPYHQQKNLSVAKLKER